MNYVAPPYVFQEFPKWVKDPAGEPVLVYSAQEEAALTGGPAPEPAPQFENALFAVGGVDGREIPQPEDGTAEEDGDVVPASPTELPRRRGRPPKLRAVE